MTICTCTGELCTLASAWVVDCGSEQVHWLDYTLLHSTVVHMTAHNPWVVVFGTLLQVEGVGQSMIHPLIDMEEGLRVFGEGSERM